MLTSAYADRDRVHIQHRILIIAEVLKVLFYFENRTSRVPPWANSPLLPLLTSVGRLFKVQLKQQMKTVLHQQQFWNRATGNSFFEHAETPTKATFSLAKILDFTV